MDVPPESTSSCCAAGRWASKSVPPSLKWCRLWESCPLTAKSEATVTLPQRGTLTKPPSPKIKTGFLSPTHFREEGWGEKNFFVNMHFKQWAWGWDFFAVSVETRSHLCEWLLVSSARSFDCLNRSMDDPPLLCLCAPQLLVLLWPCLPVSQSFTTSVPRPLQTPPQTLMFRRNPWI